jgi:putative ABC transport system ATP-binding protein
MNNVAVELKNASKCWNVRDRRVVILENGDIQVLQGQSLAIMGHSGAGKSTLMHILAFLIPLDKGRIFFQGREFRLGRTGMIPEVHRNISFVFQDAKLISGLNVWENIEVPLIHRGITKKVREEMIKEALESVSLFDRKLHMPNQLSGGEMMRASIARAIISNPRIIFADEPTGSLDEKMGEKILSLLFSFVNPETSLVVVTHQMKVARKADRILTLENGKFIDGSQ